MAVDEALLNTSNQSNERLTLRLYSWNPPAVSLGYGQNLEEEIDPRKCESYGISIVRRITGGRIVLHDQEFPYLQIFLQIFELHLAALVLCTFYYQIICNSIFGYQNS